MYKCELVNGKECTFKVKDKMEIKIDTSGF